MVLSEYQLTASEVLTGKIDPASTVWALGGQAGNIEMTVESQIFTGSGGAGVFVVVPDNLTGKTMVLGGFPVSAGSVILGFGCSNGEGFTKATPVKSANSAAYALDTSVNRLAPFTEIPAQGLSQVSMSDFKAALGTS